MSERTRVLATVFGLSLNVVLLQVVLSRLFAGLIYNQFHYFPISLALLGLCGGGVALFAYEERFQGGAEAIARRYTQRALWASLAFVGLVLLVNATSECVVEKLVAGLEPEQPKEQIEGLFFRTRIPLLFLYGAAAVLPFYFLGITISALLKAYARMVNTVYFVDLVGATAGAILAVPVLNGLPSVGYLLCGPLLCAGCHALWERRGVAYLLGVVALFGVVAGSGWPSLDATTLRRFNPEQNRELVATRWSSTAYMQIERIGEKSWRVLQDHQSTALVAGFSEGSRGCALRGEPCRVRNWILIATALRGVPDSMCVVAAGVGIEMIEGWRFGVNEIVGLEMNPHLLPFGDEVFPEAQLPLFMEQAGVSYVNDESRHYLSSVDRSFDLIVVPPTGRAKMTAAPTTPNHLLTVEAVTDYFAHLSEDGLIMFLQRRPWQDDVILARVVRMIRHGLEAAGVADVGSHVLALEPGYFIVGKRPFTDQDLKRLWVVRDLKPVSFEKLEQQVDTGTERITDDFPFWASATTLAEQWNDFTRVFRIGGEVLTAATINSVANVVAALLVVLVIFFPLLRAWGGGARLKGGDWARVAYFFCLGAGFMMIEIPLMQKLVFALGNPVYSISFCLAVLLASTGVGSQLSGRLLWNGAELHRRRLRFGFLVLLALQLALYLGVGPLLVATLSLPTWQQHAVLGAAIVPLGLFSGLPFPQGIALLRERGRARLIPWAWGVNGAASVLAVNLATTVTHVVGISPLFLVALGLYVVAFALLDAALLDA